MATSYHSNHRHIVIIHVCIIILYTTTSVIRFGFCQLLSTDREGFETTEFFYFHHIDHRTLKEMHVSVCVTCVYALCIVYTRLQKTYPHVGKENFFLFLCSLFLHKSIFISLTRSVLFNFFILLIFFFFYADTRS